MKRRDFLRWTVLAPVVGMAAPVVNRLTPAVQKAPRMVPDVEFVRDSSNLAVSVVVNHVEMLRLTENMFNRLSNDGIARIVNDVVIRRLAMVR